MERAEVEPGRFFLKHLSIGTKKYISMKMPHKWLDSTFRFHKHGNVTDFYVTCDPTTFPIRIYLQPITQNIQPSCFTFTLFRENLSKTVKEWMKKNCQLLLGQVYRVEEDIPAEDVANVKVCVEGIVRWFSNLWVVQCVPPGDCRCEGKWRGGVTCRGGWKY